MAKRKSRPHKTIGLEPNNLCPHCGRKVKQVHRFGSIGGTFNEYIVEHWWWPANCFSDKEKIKTYLDGVKQE